MTLSNFLSGHRDEIIARCREKVGRRPVPRPTEAELDIGIPLFVEQVIQALNDEPVRTVNVDLGAATHGSELLKAGFSVSQVVHSYGDVCQSITDLAVDLGAPITTKDFRTLNRCLDDAIASAVTEHTKQRETTLVKHEIALATEHLGVLSHELRNLTNSALMAFEVLKTASVGVDGSTSAILGRSLLGLRDLINRSLVEVRLAAKVRHTQEIAMNDFLQEVAGSATLEAKARRLHLTVLPADPSVTVDADRQILASVVGNLLQNAIKFTRAHTGVVLRLHTSAERVFVEIEDECGGLPDTQVEALFRAFEQKGADRSGVGLGLAISRDGARACGGEILVRNTPGVGCVFVVDLPRPHRKQRSGDARRGQAAGDRRKN